jgi:integrase
MTTPLTFDFIEACERVGRYADAIAGRRQLPLGWLAPSQIDWPRLDGQIPDEVVESAFTPPPCMSDPFSVVGLRTLERSSPDTWRGLLRSYLSEEELEEVQNGSQEDATLRQVLLAHSVELLPDAESRITFDIARRARLVLGAVVEHFGDVPAHRIDEEMLRVIRRVCKERMRRRGRVPLSGSNASRAMTVLRRALDDWRRNHDLPPLVPQPDPLPAPRRSAKVTVRLRPVWQNIVAVNRFERLKIALGVGVGLREPEIEALREDDFRFVMMPAKVSEWWCLPPVALLYVRVRGAQPHLVRWIPLPQWLAAFVRDVLKERQPGDLLFPPDVASLAAVLRRFRGKFPDEVGMTPSALRTTWQGIARQSGCSHEAVRATWRQEEGEKGWQWHHAQRELVVLAVDWSQFGSGVAGLFVDRRDRVPRRAPKGCGPRDPEIRPQRERRPDPMPPGAGELPHPTDIRLGSGSQGVGKGAGRRTR